jgi:hypothetical protein
MTGDDARFWSMARANGLSLLIGPSQVVVLLKHVNAI